MNNKMIIPMLGAALLLSACEKKNLPDTQMKDSSTKVESSTSTNKAQVKSETSSTNGKASAESKVSSDGSSSSTQVSHQKENATPGAGSQVVVSEAKIKAEEAFEDYMTRYPQSKIDSFQLSEENGKLVYKIEGYDAKNEHDLVLDANSKEVVKQETDNLGPKQGKEITKEDLSKLSGFLKKAAEDAGAGYAATEYEIDYNDGVKVVTVEMDAPNQDDITYTFNHENEQLLEKDQ